MSLSAHDISADVAEQHPIFSFANGEMGAFSSGFIRALERVTGQPKIKKLYVDYVDDIDDHQLHRYDNNRYYDEPRRTTLRNDGSDRSALYPTVDNSNNGNVMMVIMTTAINVRVIAP